MVSSNKKKTKQKLWESDSENEVADFPRLIVIESLEEVYLAKFSSFFIEKVISTWASPKTLENKELQLACRGRQLEAGRKYIKNKNISCDKMQSPPAWETQHFQGSYQE